jgi:hypothetical protein
MVEFERYRSYSLNFGALAEESVDIREKSGNSLPKKFMEAIEFFSEREPLEVPEGMLPIRCSDGEYDVRSNKLFVDEILRLVLSLRKDGVSVSSCTWFFIDRDDVMDSPQRSNRFFLAAGRGIVRESAGITDCLDLKADVLKSYDDEIEVWADGKRDRKAWAHRMYERFYDETESGRFQRVKERLATEQIDRDFPDAPKVSADAEAIIRAIESSRTGWTKLAAAAFIGAAAASVLLR